MSLARWPFPALGQLKLSSKRLMESTCPQLAPLHQRQYRQLLVSPLSGPIPPDPVHFPSCTSSAGHKCQAHCFVPVLPIPPFREHPIVSSLSPPTPPARDSVHYKNGNADQGKPRGTYIRWAGRGWAEISTHRASRWRWLKSTNCTVGPRVHSRNSGPLLPPQVG